MGIFASTLIHGLVNDFRDKLAKVLNLVSEAESVHSTKHNIKWHKIRLPYAYSLYENVIVTVSICYYVCKCCAQKVSQDGCGALKLDMTIFAYQSMWSMAHSGKKKKLTDLAHVKTHLENLNGVKSSIYRWIFPYKPSVFGDFPFWFCHNLSTAGPWAIQEVSVVRTLITLRISN